MQCPKCKWANEPGQPYCQMCYEPFNHSAAKSYLHAMKKERREEEKAAQESSARQALHSLDEAMTSLGAAVDQAELRRMLAKGRTLLQRFRWALRGLGVLMGLGLVILFGQKLYAHFRLYRLAYDYRDSPSVQMLVGFHSEIRCWAERQGRLDTPMLTEKVDNLGNVVIELQSRPKEKAQNLSIRVVQWVQMADRNGRSENKTLPANHPSLAPGHLLIDKKGNLQARQYVLTPRLGKSAEFMFPAFPKDGLKYGQTWTLPMRWAEGIGEWAVLWSGEAQWTLKERIRCGDDTCAHLTYSANLAPKLVGRPSWSANATGSPNYRGQMNGSVLFDLNQHRVIDNHMTHSGQLRIPINDLGLIPREQRIGRAVDNISGELLVDFQNRVELREN